VGLLQAASGLERLMVGVPQNGPLKDSTVAQVSALFYYQANVLAKLEKDKGFHRLFKKTLFDQINKEFGEYIDAKARIQPKSLHHVYEWNRAGRPTARLFKLTSAEGLGLSFKINYEFKLSKSPVPSKNKKQKRKYIFANKASVMEKGMPIVIRPQSAERLVFEMNGMTVFMPKGASVMVKNPGGSAARNQFDLAYSRYFSGPLVSSAIKNSGFQQIFGTKITKALSAPASIKKVKYSFSPNAVRMEADSALAKEFGGVL
jgi:hypothetical protein